MYDLIIKNGKIADGTGGPWFQADIGVIDGKIATIGKLDEAESIEVIDAKGLVVAPGFIEIHSHADFILPTDSTLSVLEGFLKQGITTVVTGNCGLSPFPLEDETRALLDGYTAFFQGEQLEFNWRSTGEYLDVIEKKGSYWNVIPMIGHGPLRICTMGFEARQATKAELDKMRRLCAEAMEEGAFGLSAGLIYAPGMYADTNELIEITKPLQKHNGYFSAHIRGSSDSGFFATDELIQIAKANEIRVQNSHMEVFGKSFWYLTEDRIAMYETARRQGYDMGFDVIPYTSANTTLGAAFPGYAFEGGVPGFIRRMNDKEMRAKIKHDALHMKSDWPTWGPNDCAHNFVRSTGYDNVYLIWVGSEKNQKYMGKNMIEIGKMMGVDPFDAAADIFVEENGAALALYYGVSGDAQDDYALRTVVAHPLASINTDAILTGKGIPHPAGVGAFPKVLGYFCRDLGLFSMEEAVRKMTSMSAQRVGVYDRGIIRENLWADITIFEFDMVRDNTTFDNPKAPPDGIKYVIVNGKVVVKDNVIDVSAKHGKILRKGK